MKKKIIEIPEGIQYISDWKDYKLPGGRCIVDKGVTGCGYTEFCLTNNENIVLCSPRRLLLENKDEQHIGDSNILYLKNEIEEFFDVNNFENTIFNHIFKCKFDNKPVKFMVTYDSTHYVIDYLKKKNLLGNFYFIVDEFQSLMLDSFFKADIENDFLDSLEECPNVIYLSATPLLDKYLNMLDQFKDLQYYTLDWSKSGYVEKIKIQRKQTRDLNQECYKIIDKYLGGEFPTALSETGEVRESREAVFYLNSVSDIIRIVKNRQLTPGQVNIICSNTEKNVKKLRRIKHKIGKVPLKTEPSKMFTFCTSTVYVGADFYSDCASTYIFANPNLRHLALDIILDLPQIAGRQRNKSNIFKNNIVIFYKTLRGEKLDDREAFDKLQAERKYDSYDGINFFDKGTDNQKKIYKKKIRASIEVDKYADDFISLSRKTGKPVYNPLIEIAQERAWVVAQEDYQDSINLTKAIQSKFETDKFCTEKEKFVQEFLDNQFYRTGIFMEKMRMYCEFMDEYGSDPEMFEIIYYKVKDPRYHNFYRFYGTQGCRAREYREGELEKGFQDQLKKDKISSEIYQEFKIGDKITPKDAKLKLKAIYDKLKINKVAKAIDLEEYFKITNTTTMNKESKKLIKLIKLDKKA